MEDSVEDGTEGGYTAYPAGTAPDEIKRDRAIRKVAAFLKANYGCNCDDYCQADELDEAATIVEIVEGILL